MDHWYSDIVFFLMLWQHKISHTFSEYKYQQLHTFLWNNHTMLDSFKLNILCNNHIATCLQNYHHRQLVLNMTHALFISQLVTNQSAGQFTMWKETIQYNYISIHSPKLFHVKEKEGIYQESSNFYTCTKCITQVYMRIISNYMFCKNRRDTVFAKHQPVELTERWSNLKAQ